MDDASRETTEIPSTAENTPLTMEQAKLIQDFEDRLTALIGVPKPIEDTAEPNAGHQKAERTINDQDGNPLFLLTYEGFANIGERTYTVSQHNTKANSVMVLRWHIPSDHNPLPETISNDSSLEITRSIPTTQDPKPQRVSFSGNINLLTDNPDDQDNLPAILNKIEAADRQQKSQIEPHPIQPAASLPEAA